MELVRITSGKKYDDLDVRVGLSSSDVVEYATYYSTICRGEGLFGTQSPCDKGPSAARRPISRWLAVALVFNVYSNRRSV